MVVSIFKSLKDDDHKIPDSCVRTAHKVYQTDVIAVLDESGAET